ncbi:putative cation-transporting ATPase 1 [Dispira parvispora]|uniref:Cation-transporting ATPase 1 n=1 Tax=Dispira parvispora TaxID=1520584 RepID=A0A9W8E754_9FUNG|nr:putative cation-transporting ATPase 1 [Dispira parvispora]
MADPQKLVPSRSIRSASLHIRLPRWQHLYVWPYLALYPFWLNIYVNHYNQYLGSTEYTFLSLGLLLVVHGLTFLAGQWSIPVKARTTCQRTTSVDKADVIQIIPIKDRGQGALCTLERSEPTTLQPRGSVFFYYQKKRYTYDEDRKQFVKIRYPSKDRPSLATFQNSTGLVSSEAVATQLELYGPNKFDIPLPTFQELFKEHAVAPFFIFQLFCVGLWCLDEYWYYSLFTLLMLVVFESTVVFQRLRTLREFRSLSMPPYEILVYRNGTWQPVLSDQLLPADVCSLTRSQGESGVPCDMILVEGSCIVNEAMLSGESTPLLKESINLRDPHDRLDMEGVDKLHMLFGGTKILQATAGGSSNNIPSPPDHGCMAYVLRTGFGSAQGKLVRTMIFNTDRVSANNVEALMFILFLLIFAVAAAWYVWDEGMNNPKRKKFKVILDCIMIVTSVVPPELPMELSLAVNTSLVALTRLAIFCTEPFRIPFAGKLDICCFDKTGTLTSEDLVVEGVAGIGNDLGKLYHPQQLPQETTLTLAGAHALVLMQEDVEEEATVVGDPMEKVTLQAMGWQLFAGDRVRLDPDTVWEEGKPSTANVNLSILRRFQFSSALKRMSAVVRCQKGISPTAGDYVYAAVKGAPETLQTMITHVPDGYEEAYKAFSRQGSRVLALGYKPMPKLPLHPTDAELNALTREEVESGLTFAGFLVFHCPLKPDSKKAVDMLNRSSHRVVMITGDNPLTACHIAKELDIVERPVLVLDIHQVSGEPTSKTSAHDPTTVLQWTSVDEKVVWPMNPDQAQLDSEMVKQYDLCLTGAALGQLEGKPVVHDLISHVWVYARVSPGQKEYILTTMKQNGYFTLMCGDGTNDVGALKQSHVGVALLNGKPEDLQKIAERQQFERMKSAYEAQVKFTQRFNMPPPTPHPSLQAMLDAQARKAKEVKRKRKRLLKANQEKLSAGSLEDQGAGETNPETSNKTKKHKKKDKHRKDAKAPVAATTNGTAPPAALANERLQNLIQELEMDDDVPVIKFGDASVASPFTSKLSSVMAVCNIVRQGRCTLVATMQMYKILALNSLISAYSLSVLYLDGIKFGDSQVTILGMMVAVCFMCISRASPREELSRQRPQTNIFNPYIILSVLGQFTVHIVALIYVTQNAKLLGEMGEVDLDGDFSPTLLNTAVYFISLSMQISTFAINYQGYPFRESLRDNKVLYRGLLMVGGICVAGATEFIPEFNSMMSFVPLPPEFKVRLLTAMALDFGLAWFIEFICNRFFSDNRPKAIVASRNA